MKNLFLPLSVMLGLVLYSPIALAGPSDLPASPVYERPDSTPVAYWGERPDWALWQSLTTHDFAPFAGYWSLASTAPYLVQVTNQDHKPLANAQVQLISQEGHLIWSARSNLKGEALLWAGQATTAKRIVASYGPLSQHSTQLLTLDKGKNQVQLATDCQRLQGIDLVFLLDATHSMRDEFSALFASLKNSGHPILLARDLGERYLTQRVQPTHNFTYQAAGGGSDEEAMDTILMAALQEHDWDTQAATRLLVYITDAQPAKRPGAADRLRRAAAYAAERGVQILPIAASGMQEEGAYILQSLAWLTNTHYAWLEGKPTHRLPLLQSTAQHSTLADWLTLIEEGLGAYDSCPSTLPAVNDMSTHFARCFPNPAANQTKLKLSSAAEQVRLYDANGKVIRTWQQLAAGVHTIDLSELPDGVYAVEVQTGKQRQSIPLVVSK